MYANAGSIPGKDPVLDGFYKVMDGATDDTGRVDWDKVDGYKAALPQAQQDYLDRNTGLTFKGIPEVAEYKADVKRIADSGYWDIADAEAQKAAQHFGFAGVQTEKELTNAVRNKILTDLGDSPQTRASLPMFESKLLNPYYSAISQSHALFLRDHQNLVPLFLKWGYGAPTKTLAQFGAPVGAR